MATRRSFPIQTRTAVVNRCPALRVPLVVLATFIFCGIAGAQSKLIPGIEVFGGYSHLSFQSGALGLDNRTQMNGWDFALSIPHIYQGLGITGDVSGEYASTLEQYTYAVGPQYKWEFDHFRVIAHGLYGKAQTRVREAGSTFTEPSDRQKTFIIGGEFDLPLGKSIWVRAVQADYLRTSAFGGTQNNFRVATGLIYAFGKH
jgi:hypothetical protein